VFVALEDVPDEQVFKLVPQEPLIGVVVVTFETMIVIGVEVERLPARSRAVARRVWEPLVMERVFQVPEYGAVVSSGPSGELSSLNWTAAIPLVV
jgi:hypothetical protein